ncbi:hypothetical protein HMJ29_04450 [Hymenobacter taeanensis]|uniref:DUF4468 domain-containing protein n=1 Tax=Hymenobacter taeanensis TaxID=2735321 RepID=A0A6M6BE27_9BACT|nr:MULTISPECIES: hypothetical protein [Hymenobacter]QJX46229.1 hypothetical protein HMJ29_04450 [Hymenobacter taeanensis]UOQ80084.1 hypothetical protein MUN83_14720 [Hymenobacter sp. 5414T-23]
MASPACGQARSTGPLYARTHRFVYTAVVPVAGVIQADLVLRAGAWARRVTPAGQLPISTSGPDTEVVKTTGACPFAYEWGGQAVLGELRYAATISVREGRYRYEVKDFAFVEPGAGRSPASTTPAETYYNGNFKPYTEQASRFQATMRTCFTEIVQEELARLQESMSQLTNKPGNE